MQCYQSTSMSPDATMLTDPDLIYLFSVLRHLSQVFPHGQVRIPLISCAR